MRNLKRALSLGLTAAMISGLMVMGSSAVSYPDSDEIQNQTAVEILGEIGVMVGDDNGNFNPTQDVTRAEMAVIITRILYGNDLNVDQFKGMNLFTDVPAWAEGFVNLCASLDIVAGVGDGKFAPNETVTAAQAALMLSRALGYFQNNAEFGNDWALAAIRRATSAGIIGDDMVLAANEGLSRDNVAQMTFNTLTKAVPVQYNELLNVYYNENQGITYALTFNYLQTLGYTNFDLVYDNGDTTIYGRPATTWGIGTYRTTTGDKDSGTRYDGELDANGGLISSNVQILSKDEIITIANEPDYVYTDATAEEDIYDDLGAALCDEDEYDWSAYVNGDEVASADVVVPTRNEGDPYAYTGEGTQTEIYIDEGAKTVTVVEINYYLGQVASVNEDEGTVTVRTVSDLDSARLDDRTFATTEFAKGDYVVFTIDQNADDDFYICEMTAPETVDGTVTRVNKNDNSENAYLFLDRETRYDYSDHMAYDLNDETVVQHPELEKEYTLYLDPNGYVLAYSGDTTKSFLYVQDSDEELSDWEARVVLADGTDDVVMVDSDLDHGIRAAVNFDDEDKVEWATENTDLANFPNWVDSTELDNWDTIRGKITDIDYQIWEYDTNDAGDLYTLTGRTTRYQSGVTINNGQAYIRGEFSEQDVLIDNSTIFVDLNSNTAYTGYSNVPDVENADIAYVLEDDSTRDVAEIVYIIDGDIYDADATVFVLTSDDRDTERYDGDNYYEFDDMYVDGRHTTGLYVAYDALDEIHYYNSDRTFSVDLDNDGDFEDSEIESVMVGKVFKVLKSEDNYITEIELVNNWAPAATSTSSALDVMEHYFGDNNRNLSKYTTDSDTIYVVVEELYNRSMTKFEGYDVFEGNYDDIVEWADNGEMRTDRDGYTTLVQVVKDDDQNADLVYIYKFLPEYHFRTVTINVNGEEYFTTNEDNNYYLFCQARQMDVNGAIGAFEEAMEAAGFESGKNKFTYSVEGYEDEGYTGALIDSTVIAIPTGHDDLVINITATNEDIATDPDTGLILDVTAADDATPADYIDMYSNGTIRYGFKVSAENGAVESVSWLETVVNAYGRTDRYQKTAEVTDLDFIPEENAYLVQATAEGVWNLGDVRIVRVTNATVNAADPAPTYELTIEEGSGLAAQIADGTTTVWVEDQKVEPTAIESVNGISYKIGVNAGDKVQFTGMTPGDWKVDGVTYEVGPDGIWTLTVAGNMTINDASFVAQVDIVDAAGNPLATGDLNGSNVTFTMAKGENAGTGFMFDGKYYAYGDEVTLPLASGNTNIAVTPGYIVVDIEGDAAVQYQTANEDHYSALAGTGTGYILSKDGGETWTYVPGNTLAAKDATTDLMIKKGYVAVGYSNANIDVEASDAYASVTDGKFTVTYTVTGLQVGDNVTVTFTSGNNNLSDAGSANVDTFAAVSSEMTRTVELTLATMTMDVTGITFTAVH